jgi:hypothetical protein
VGICSIRDLDISHANYRLRLHYVAWLLGNHTEAEIVMVETLRSIEIVNVDRCFDDRLDLQGRAP